LRNVARYFGVTVLGTFVICDGLPNRQRRRLGILASLAIVVTYLTTGVILRDVVLIRCHKQNKKKKAKQKKKKKKEKTGGDAQLWFACAALESVQRWGSANAASCVARFISISRWGFFGGWLPFLEAGE